MDKTLGSGTGPFLLFVVRDPSPVYGPRVRSWGTGIANVAIYDAKTRYRTWTGGGFRVHATTDRNEAERDLFLLLGQRASSLADLPALDWGRAPDPWRGEVLGADGWASREELLRALELTTRYAVLREPDTLLVADDRWARDLIGAGGRIALRSVGDGSLDAEWQRAILREVVRDERGRRIATAEHRFHARLYEVVAHGVQVPRAELQQLAAEAGAPEGDYREAGFAKAVLDGFLHHTGWRYVLPRDPTIPRNPAVLGRHARLRRAVKERAPGAARVAGRLASRFHRSAS